MSQNKSSEFKCQAPISNDGDHMVVEWDIGEHVYFACYQNSSACVALGREQVAELRDRLTKWLEFGE